MKKLLDIEIEGFRSIVKPTKFNLNRVGLNLLRGVNGSGKTSFIEAIAWAIYGINLKGTKSDKVVTWKEKRDSDFRGTRVIIDVQSDSHYRIARHIKFRGETEGLKGGDSLMVFKNGELIGSHWNKNEMQEYIDNNVIGVNSKIFLNSILFGQRMKRIIESDNKDKRDLFEELFDVDWTDILRQSALEDKQKIKDRIIEIDKELPVVQSNIANLERNIERDEELIENFYDQVDNELDKLQEDRKNKEKEIKKLQNTKEEVKFKRPSIDKEKAKREEAKAKEKISELAESVNNVRFNVAENKEKIKKYEKNIDKIKEDLKSIPEKCDRCNRNFKDDYHDFLKALENDILGYEEELKIEKRNLNSNQHYLKKLQEDLEDWKGTEKYYRKIVDGWLEYDDDKYDKLIEEKEKYIKWIDKKIQEWEEAEPPETKIEQYEEELKKEKVKIERLKERKAKENSKLEEVDWWLKNFTSIKSYVFFAMLQKLNRYIEEHGKRLGVSMKLTVDLDKASKPFEAICNVGNSKNKDYSEFSGGEKQRLDIVLMMSMYDLISEFININILLLDEVFEGLDEDGESIIFDLIRFKSERKAIYIISHSAVRDNLYFNIIDFKLNDKGQTKIEYS